MSEDVCHLPLQDAAEVSHQLVATWVLMHKAPKTDAVVCGCLHTLVDDFRALGVAVEVVHHVKQAVNEADGRLIFVQGFQCESASVARQRMSSRRRLVLREH